VIVRDNRFRQHDLFPLPDHTSDTLRNGRMSSCTSGSDIDAVQTECSSNHLTLGRAETESLMKSKWNHDLSLTTYQCGCHCDPEKATSLLVNNINGVHSRVVPNGIHQQYRVYMETEHSIAHGGFKIIWHLWPLSWNKMDLKAKFRYRNGMSMKENCQWFRVVTNKVTHTTSFDLSVGGLVDPVR